MSYLENFKKGGASGQQDAFQYIINDLLRDNKTGADKLTSIGGVDMESSAPVSFVPSMFYAFLYISGALEKSGSVEFYDMVPVILCTGYDGTKVTGINFNFIPNDVRAAFLDILTGNFKEYYEEDIFDDEFRVNEDLGFVLTNPEEFNKLITISKNLLKYDVSKCIRTYEVKRIFRPRMIENDMLDSIVNLSFKDAVRGINLAKFQADLISQNK